MKHFMVYVLEQGGVFRARVTSPEKYEEVKRAGVIDLTRADADFLVADTRGLTTVWLCSVIDEHDFSIGGGRDE